MEIRPRLKSGFYLDEVQYLPIAKLIMESLHTEDYLKKDIRDYYKEVQSVISRIKGNYIDCNCLDHLPFKHIRLGDGFDLSSSNPHVAFCSNCGRPFLHINYTPLGKKFAYLIGSSLMYFWNVDSAIKTKDHQQALVTCFDKDFVTTATYEIFSGKPKNQDNFFSAKR